MCNNDLVRTAKAFIEVQRKMALSLYDLMKADLYQVTRNFPSAALSSSSFYSSSSFERFLALKKASAKANTQQNSFIALPKFLVTHRKEKRPRRIRLQCAVL